MSPTTRLFQTLVVGAVTASVSGAQELDLQENVARIPGARGAVLTALGTFPWDSLDCAGPSVARVYPSVRPIFDTLLPPLSLFQEDLTRLNSVSRTWILGDTAMPIGRAQIQLPDTLLLRAELWRAHASTDTERATSAERRYAAVNRAVVRIVFDRCWQAPNEYGYTCLGMAWLHRQNNSWRIDTTDILTC